MWGNSTSGRFLIKSAYTSLQQDSWNPRDSNWKFSWKFQRPQRVRFFLWLAYKQRLLKNSERSRQGLSQSAVCSMCGHMTEDTIHVLQDCVTARQVWQLVVPNNIQNKFFLEPLDSWILSNICSPLYLQDHGVY